MISKERFVEIIQFLRSREPIYQDFYKYFNDSVLNPMFEMEDVLVKLLKEALHDEYDNIDYFIYDLDMGKNWTEDVTSDPELTLALKNEESLYDYLFKCYMEKYDPYNDEVE